MGSVHHDTGAGQTLVGMSICPEWLGQRILISVGSQQSYQLHLQLSHILWSVISIRKQIKMSTWHKHDDPNLKCP